MKPLGALLRVALALVFAAGQAFGIAPQDTPKAATGSISGRVVVDGRPAAGALVALVEEPGGVNKPPFARLTADEEGRFHAGGVPAGRYRVWPTMGGLAPLGSSEGGSRSVTVGDGQAVEGVDLELARGGVITGRVTNADGRPVVREQVTLVRIGEDGTKNLVLVSNPYRLYTDDRGIYRVFGLAGGRYLVSVGREAGPGPMRFGAGAWYAKTYHPNAPDEARATIVDLAPGGEVAGVDIAAGRRTKTLSVSGRLVDAETSEGVAGIGINLRIFAEISGRTELTGSIVVGASVAGGSFRVEGLNPGRYLVGIAQNEKSGDYFGDPVPVTIADQDVTGVEVRLHRGASISGGVVLEGANDPSIQARISQAFVIARMVAGRPEDLERYPDAVAPVGQDGSFRLGGIRAGQVALNMTAWRGTKGFSLQRVERDGVEVPGPLDVQGGEHVTGVKVVLGYGTATIRGRVKIEGGMLPPGAVLNGNYSKVGGRGGWSVTVDAQGQFLAEGLLPGEYEVTIRAFVAPGSGRPPKTGSKRVTVGEGAESQVEVTVDLAEDPGGGRP